MTGPASIRDSVERQDRGRDKIPVAIIGATGTVGQKLVALLVAHPWFQIATLHGSAASAGKRYGDIVHWRDSSILPEAVASQVIHPAHPTGHCSIVFSALKGAVARPIEEQWARAGATVVTNASAFRMDPDVPLLIPEINPGHLALLDIQRINRRWPGAIVANPNCSTAQLALALAPLHRAFGLTRIFVSTMQALSGAGYPGVSAMDGLGNVIPLIPEEEEKIEHETGKILGDLTGGIVLSAPFTVSAHANRVPVLDGHMETVSMGFSHATCHEDIVATPHRIPRIHRKPGPAELP